LVPLYPRDQGTLEAEQRGLGVREVVDVVTHAEYRYESAINAAAINVLAISL